MTCPAYVTSDHPRAPVQSRIEVRRLLSWMVASLALASGLIHLAVVRHHLGYAVVAAAFVAIGGTQVLFAALMAARPSAQVRTVGLLMHLAVLTTWLLSRTIGLVVVPGAEAPAPVGVADVTATLLSVAVIASLLAVGRVDRRPNVVALPARLSRGVATAVTILALGVTVPAAAASHDHAHHGPPSADAPGGGQPPAATVHAGHPHTHE